MLHLRKILVPTDFSECGTRAIDYAAGMAEKTHAELILLHVVPREGRPGEAVLSTRHFPNLEDEIQRGSESQLEEIAKRLEGVQIRRLVEKGTPFAAIARTALREGADLIVMGTHGRGRLMHALVGSTAERVVRVAPCPVLTLKG